MSFATFLLFHAAISKYMKGILNFQMVQSSYKILPNQNNFRLNQYQRWDFVTTCIFIFQALHIYEMNKDFSCNEKLQNPLHRSLLASLSDSKRVRMSPSRTGPLTLRMICRFCSPINSTLTWVHWPWLPVRPRTLMTRALITCLSILITQ